MSKQVLEQVKVIREYKLPKLDKSTDNRVSFSQFYMYDKCPLQWYLTYVKDLSPYDPSIHALFGTAMHETIQSWLTEMYDNTISSAMKMNLNELLEERIKKTFKKEKFRNSNKPFSSPKELQEFYNDGVNILDFLVKKRADYFSKKNDHLVGCEVPILYPLRSNIYFKGFIDLVLYNEALDRYKIIDIKTSTRGWKDFAKKDETKMSQLVLYKEFFSRQFNIDIEKIDVEFFIVKRKIPLNSDYMAKYVQLHVPAAGKVKRKKVLRKLDEFIDQVFDTEANYKDFRPEGNPSKSNCRFCPFSKNNYLCDVGISS